MSFFLRRAVKASFRRICRALRIEEDILFNWIYDFKRYNKNCAVSSAIGEKAVLETLLLREYHAIEKGLSLKNPRRGFGAQKLNNILEALDEYIPKYGVDDIVAPVLSALFQYQDFHKGCEEDVEDKSILERISQHRMTYPDKVLRKSSECDGGTREVYTAEILKYSSVDFDRFAWNRYSVRDFLSRDVSLDVIDKAIEIAKKTPSVSNRQGWKVHVYPDGNLKKLILERQPGNRGFCESVPLLLLVTGVASSFYQTENKQMYIDGGLFSMSVMYALHSLSLGSCPLASNFDRNYDKSLREVANIGENEVPIMMIAVGYLPERINVPVAKRKDLSRIRVVHV
jgi:nitroreductase